MHLLGALIAQHDGIVRRYFRVSECVPKRFGGGNRDGHRPPPVTRVGAAAVELQASKQGPRGRVRRGSGAIQGRKHVSAEHILLAIATIRKDPAAELLAKNGASREAILQALTTVRGSHRVTSQNPESTFRALEQYGRDLIELARRGKLDPVIGRDDEIRRVMQILARRTKNNPVLIGEPGVGKTAVVEGLACQ